MATASNGDRLIAIWEAHTEYYSYQIWHIPGRSNQPLVFGPLTYPGYTFPFSPLGFQVNAVDLLITPAREYDQEEFEQLLPGPQLYASQVLGESIMVATSFTPDDYGRERYLIWSAFDAPLRPKLPGLVKMLITIENYTHLILLPYSAFTHAVDQVQIFEQRHLYQRSLITKEINRPRTPSCNNGWKASRRIFWR